MVFYFKGVIAMKDKLTQSEFNRISELVHCALDAPNKKEAERYIQQIPYVCLYLCGPARNILSELTATTKSASGRVSNKERLTVLFFCQIQYWLISVNVFLHVDKFVQLSDLLVYRNGTTGARKESRNTGLLNLIFSQL